MDKHITDTELLQALMNDPFAAAANDNRSAQFKNGKITGSREVVKAGWPYNEAKVKPEASKVRRGMPW
jgi:hypothetical protein